MRNRFYDFQNSSAIPYQKYYLILCLHGAYPNTQPVSHQQLDTTPFESCSTDYLSARLSLNQQSFAEPHFQSFLMDIPLACDPINTQCECLKEKKRSRIVTLLQCAQLPGKLFYQASFRNPLPIQIRRRQRNLHIRLCQFFKRYTIFKAV